MTQPSVTWTSRMAAATRRLVLEWNTNPAGRVDGRPPPRGYDAFISYSHAVDHRTAVALQRGLHRIGQSRLRRSQLRIFRDEANLAASPELWPDIERALDASETLILLASPESSKSHWVNREVQHWLSNYATRRFFIVVTAGQLAWDTSAGTARPASGSTALPTAALKLIRGEPLHVDLSWARGQDELSFRDPRFQDALAALAAPLHGKENDEVISDDLRRQRRIRNLLISVAVVILTLALVASYMANFAFDQRDAARRQTDQAVALGLATSSRASLSLNPALGLALAAESVAASEQPPLASLDALVTARVAYAERKWQPVRTPLQQPGKWVYDVVFSPDDSSLAITGGDGTVRLWDPTTGQPLGEPFGSPEEGAFGGMVDAIMFSPDGSTLATAGDDQAVRLWDPTTGKETGPTLRSSDRLSDIAFAPDGRTLASAGLSGDVLFWDTATGRADGPLPVVGDVLAFNPDGSRLAVASQEGIQFWDTRAEERFGPVLPVEAQIHALAFSPDGSMLAAASADEVIRLWDVATGRAMGGSLTGHVGAVYDVEFSPDGSLLASAGVDASLRLWRTDGGEPVGTPVRGHVSHVHSVAFSGDGSLLASASVDGTVRLWDLNPGSPLGELLVDTGDTAIRGVAFDSDGSLLGASADDRRVWVGRPASALPELEKFHANFVAFGSGGSLLASQDSGQTHRLISLDTSRPVGEPIPLNNRLVTISMDQTLLASVGQEGELRLHNPLSGELLISIPQDDTGQPIQSLALSADASLLASGSYDGRVQLWDTASGAPIGEPLLAEEFSVNDLAFSPDGSVLASANSDDTVRLWNVSTGEPVGDPLIGHSDDVYSVAFSPDGALLASGGNDNSIRLWDPVTGVQVGVPITGHDEAVFDIAFSPRGSSLASAGTDGTVRLWPAIWEVEGACDLVESHVTMAQLTQFLPEGRETRNCFRE